VRRRRKAWPAPDVGQRVPDAVVALMSEEVVMSRSFLREIDLSTRHPLAL
jgi:hypothetical protein